MSKYSNNPIIYELLQVCVAQNVRHVVISPGSRNAPLILSFAKHHEIKCYSIVDERVAAFFALGLSQEKGQTVALVCTSGTAVLNYASAVAEAYYQNIPLLIISADRPKELIDQAEGQSIRQESILENIVEKSYDLPSDTAQYHIDYARRITTEAVSICRDKNRPVHINIPLWEPLYETRKYEEIHLSPMNVSMVEKTFSTDTIQRLSKVFAKAEKVLVLVGFMSENEKLNKLLEQFSNEKNVVVLTESIANLKSKTFHYNIDRLLNNMRSEEGFIPDLLISCGGTLISKMIKQWLRKNKPTEHWHINDRDCIVDTFQAMTEDIRLLPEQFFEQLYPFVETKSDLYKNSWDMLESESEELHFDYLERISWSDLQVFDELLPSIPAKSLLHLGNSTVVRYHQLFPYNENLRYASNRGTSGIDGCTSTAAGAAYAYNGFTTLITGDISFGYDSNALWHRYISPQLRIIVINNGGGGIFRFLKESSEQQELEEFFETTHSSMDNSSLADRWGITYKSVKSRSEFSEALKEFYKPSKVAMMIEIFTPQMKNAKVLRDYFKYMNNKENM